MAAGVDPLLPSDPLASGFVPLPQPRPNLLQQAQQMWPVLQNYPVSYVEHLNERDPRGLEAWRAGEPGDKRFPRPKELPLDQYGLELISRRKTRPIDVAGDITSHFLVDQDPRIKQFYQNFIDSLTPEQHARLQRDYKYAQQHEGERRPFEQWRDISRLPAYFRGYAFQQWPKEFTDRVYTPEQRAMFDQMMEYLSGR